MKAILLAALLTAPAFALSFKEDAPMYQTPCQTPEYLTGALDLAPVALTAADLTLTSCAAPEFHADRRAGAVLADGLDLSAASFVPVADGIEAPLSDLAAMFPDRLDAAALEQAEAASGWDRGRNLGVHVVRVPGRGAFLLVHDLI